MSSGSAWSDRATKPTRSTHRSTDFPLFFSSGTAAHRWPSDALSLGRTRGVLLGLPGRAGRCATVAVRLDHLDGCSGGSVSRGIVSDRAVRETLWFVSFIVVYSRATVAPWEGEVKRPARPMPLRRALEAAVRRSTCSSPKSWPCDTPAFPPPAPPATLACAVRHDRQGGCDAGRQERNRRTGEPVTMHVERGKIRSSRAPRTMIRCTTTRTTRRKRRRHHAPVTSCRPSRTDDGRGRPRLPSTSSACCTRAGIRVPRPIHAGDV